MRGILGPPRIGEEEARPNSAGLEEDLAAVESGLGSPFDIDDPSRDYGVSERSVRLSGGAGLPHRFFSLRVMREGFAGSLARERERGLAFLFVPVALGCGAGYYFLLSAEPVMLPFTLALATSGIVAIVLFRAGHGAAILVMLLAMFLAGFIAARFEMRNPPILLDSGVTTTISGRVLRAEIDDKGKVRYLLQVAATSDPVIRRPPDRVRLVARAGHAPFAIGETITGRARLSAPSGPVLPGGYDFAFSAFTQGIGAYGFFYTVPKMVRISQEPKNRGWRLAERVQSLRSAIAARIRLVVPGDSGAVAAALTVSDRRGISDEVVENLRAAGLAHVLSISGLHMALAAGIFYVGMRRLMAFSPKLIEAWPVKKLAAAGALAISTAYLAISDASVPAERAWLMLTVLMVAVLVDRPALTMRNVAIAATIIILHNPSAVISPGFQMSFAATAALIAAYGAWARRNGTAQETGADGVRLHHQGSVLHRLFATLVGLMATSIIAGLATGLFAAYHFHRIAAYGVLGNLFAMPLVSFIVMPAGLVAMLVMPFGLDALPLKVMGLGIEGMLIVARKVADLGGNVVVGQVPFAATLIAAAGFIILIFLRSRLRLLGLVFIAMGLFFAHPAFRPPLPDILISEDGRLVGLLENGVLATNAKRPGSFVFDQWHMAMGGPEHLPSAKLDRAERDSLKLPAVPSEYGRAVGARYDPLRGLEALLSRAVGAPGRFICVNRANCAARYRNMTIVAIGDPAWIGAACDRADLVVLSVPVRMRECYSGAMLITERELRRTGSLAIFLSTAGQQAGERVKPGLTKRGTGQPNQDVLFGMQIIAAVDGVVRPWTVHRYYDWRSDSFDLPAEIRLPRLSKRGGVHASGNAASADGGSALSGSDG